MTPKKPTIVSAGPGPTAWVQFGLLRVTAALFRAFKLRGFSRIVGVLSAIFPSDNFVDLRIGSDARLRVRMGDAYWIGPLLRDRSYEPEIGHVLSRVLTHDTLFIDCGANIGYWTSLCAEVVGDPSRVVGVEAAHPVFEQLKVNEHLNGSSFTSINAAIWQESGLGIQFAVDDYRHSWGSGEPGIRDELLEAGFSDQPVTTITIDDVAKGHDPGKHRRIVIKLDIEGSELQALAGAANVLREDTTLIYEEHGRIEHPDVSHRLIEGYGMAVFFIDVNGAASRVNSAADLKVRLADRARGYNLVACRPSSSAFPLLVHMTEKVS